MWRVMRIGIILGMVCTLIAPIRAFSQQQSSESLLLKWSEPNFGISEYYLYTNSQIIPLDEGYNQFIGTDGDWLYFAERQGAGDASDGTFYLYRISLEGTIRQPIVRNADYFEWSPDHHRILYLLGASERYWYQVDPDGSNPTPFLPGEQYSVGAWFWVERLQRFVFDAWQRDTAGNIINRGIFSLNQGALQKIRPDMGLFGVSSDEQWLIVGDFNGLYRMPLDGTELLQIAAFDAFGGNWHPTPKANLANGTLLIQTDDTAYKVVRLADGELLWSFEHIVSVVAEPDAEWIYVWYPTDSPVKYTMTIYKSDGTAQRGIENPVPIAGNYHWTPDYQWVYYQIEGELKRARVDLTETESFGLGEFAGWSQDATQIYMTEYAGTVRHLYRMDLDGTHRIKITDLPIEQFPLSDFGQSVYVVEVRK